MPSTIRPGEPLRGKGVSPGIAIGSKGYDDFLDLYGEDG